VDHGSKTGGTYDCRKWAEDQRVGSVGLKATLNALAGYAGLAEDDWSCYPGQERLAKATEQGVRTIKRHVQELTERGLICHQSRPRTSGRGRSSDRYFLHVSEWCRWCEWSRDDMGPKGQSGTLNGDQSATGTTTKVPNPATKVPQPDRRSTERTTETELQTSLASQKADVNLVDPLFVAASRLASDEWERREVKPVGGKFPAFRTRILEQLQAGRDPSDLARVLPTMEVFTRDAFDYCMRSGTQRQDSTLTEALSYLNNHPDPHGEITCSRPN